MSCADGVIVTPVLVALLTTPVMSSMRASWPAARLEFVRGRAKVVVEGRAPLLLKFRERLPPVRVREFARFTSMENPALALMACEEVIVDVKGPGKEAMQTVLTAQDWLRLVMGVLVPLKKASVALEKVTAKEVYVPVATADAVPRKPESDWRRTKS